MRCYKKEGKPCGVLLIFVLTPFSQPGPARTIHLNQTNTNTPSDPKKRESITPDWLRYKKRGKPCGVFTFLCALVSAAIMFQKTHLNETGLNQDERSMALGPPFLEPYASIRPKGTLNEILFKKKRYTMWRFIFFWWVGFPTQNLPAKLKPSSSLHLNETL